MLKKVDLKDMDGVLRFFNDVDHDFSPTLSSRVNLTEYTSKLLANAIVYEFIEENTIKGIVAFYANDVELTNAYISFLAIDKEFRGNGIGEILIRTVIEYLKNNNFKYIKLTVRESSRAVEFYKKLGFSIVENKIYNDTDVNMLIMVLKI